MTTGWVKRRRHCGSKNRPWKVERASVRAPGSRVAARLAKLWLRNAPPEKARGLIAARARLADRGMARAASFGCITPCRAAAFDCRADAFGCAAFCRGPALRPPCAEGAA